MPLLVRHLAHALSAHVGRLHQQGVTVPREVRLLAEFLLGIARTRLDASVSADMRDSRQSSPMAVQLLVTKGEAADRLSVSVRTLERLVSTGRLPQVHVERAARFRVRDLEEYVDALPGIAVGNSDPRPTTAPEPAD
jgi:excisionase family DNA binding protein